MDKGNLHTFLANKQNATSWDLIIKICEDIARGMAFLHDKSKIHRDLKSPNVLLAGGAVPGSIIAKIADFGLSRSVATTIGGRGVDNPVWLAPEVMKNEEYIVNFLLERKQDI
eukprot:TRINITY_DN13381_c0_g1_i1.p1 TRINITY_DN13381_c0_g1~~TRINITY_DN13381_c0_g1_i1.p1  ORF type:complete len:113 (+),score=24.46 TRINITY_DN13381_c0_g1_i1:81-419(+)